MRISLMGREPYLLSWYVSPPQLSLRQKIPSLASARAFDATCAGIPIVAAINDTSLHHKTDMLEKAHVGEWIPGDRDNISIAPRLD
jgi:hypothetical protein